jgi:hypothetical protein
MDGTFCILHPVTHFTLTPHQTQIFTNQLENEHFERVHSGVVTQHLSLGGAASFICTARFLQLFENFYCIFPLWFYKNKWGNGKMERY